MDNRSMFQGLDEFPFLNRDESITFSYSFSDIMMRCTATSTIQYNTDYMAVTIGLLLV